MSSPTGYDGGSDASGDASEQVSGLSESPEMTHSEGDSQASPTPSDAGSGKDNPAWQPILESIPSQFHSVVKPTLKEWDRNYGKLAESYAPYKEFSQRGVSREALEQAYQLYELVYNNPQEVYRRLGDALGMTPEQAKEELESSEDGDPFADDTGDPEYQQHQLDPQIQQMQQQMEMVQQQYAELQQQRMTDEYAIQIDAEIKQLQSKHGEFDVRDVMNRFLAQMQRGESPSITKAYQEQQAFIQHVLASRQGKPGDPKVLSPGGGSPSNSEQLSLATQSDRVSAAEQMLRAAREG